MNTTDMGDKNHYVKNSGKLSMVGGWSIFD